MQIFLQLFSGWHASEKGSMTLRQSGKYIIPSNHKNILPKFYLFISSNTLFYPLGSSESNQKSEKYKKKKKAKQ